MSTFGYILYSDKPKWFGNYVFPKEIAENICKQMNEENKRLQIKQLIKIKAIEIVDRPL